MRGNLQAVPQGSQENINKASAMTLTVAAMQRHSCRGVWLLVGDITGTYCCYYKSLSFLQFRYLRNKPHASFDYRVTNMQTKIDWMRIASYLYYSTMVKPCRLGSQSAI
jgi:hypothetical protein